MGSFSKNDGDGNENGKKTIGLYFQGHHACLYISQPSLQVCDLKLPNFTRPLYGVGEQSTKIFFFPTQIRSFQIQPQTRCYNWNSNSKMELNKIDQVWNRRIHFLSAVFGLLSSRNFATMATWRNDFSSLLLQGISKNKQSNESLYYLIFNPSLFNFCLFPFSFPITHWKARGISHGPKWALHFFNTFFQQLGFLFLFA